MHLIGSFQREAVRITESPIDEVWSRIGQLGSKEYLRKTCTPLKEDIDWDEYTSYISVRALQAVELWSAYKKSTLLTSPLSLYYSFLNIHRAFLALVQEDMPRSSHGLVFEQSDDLFGSAAKLVRGSYTDWLNSCDIAWANKSKITLEECIKSCPELMDEVSTYFEGESCVSRIVINGYHNKNTRIVFLNHTDNFSEKWQEDYPNLVDTCTLVEDEVATLELSAEFSGSYEKISEWAADSLDPNLLHSSNSIWYTYRATDKPLDLPRSSFYYIGIFILSSVVRYQPELLLKDSETGSMYNWILNKFIYSAERFYPQMKLMEFTAGGQLYFKSG